VGTVRGRRGYTTPSLGDVFLLTASVQDSYPGPIDWHRLAEKFEGRSAAKLERKWKSIRGF